MIVILYPQYDGVHGIARYLQSLIANVPADASPVLLLASIDGAEERQKIGRVNVVRLPMERGRLGLLLWSLRARSFLKALGRDHALTVNLHVPPLIPGLFLPKGSQIVVTPHTTYLGMSGQFYDPPLFEGQWNGLSVFIKKVMERVIFGKAERLIVLTEQGRQELTRYDVHQPIHIIPNGVDASIFAPTYRAARRFDVLFVGRIEKRKGSRPMVEVCEKLAQLRPDARIGIVGYGDDEGYVAERLRGVDSVDLLGKISFSEVTKAYAESCIYASTSYYEGLPGTCLEAMAMELPCVVWKLPFYEGLLEHGVTGALVPTGHVDDFVAELVALIDAPDRAVKMGSQSRKVVAQGYLWEDLAPRIIKTLEAPLPGA
jgi:glycosyltransferase involved in cell wall biosynthesis